MAPSGMVALMHRVSLSRSSTQNRSQHAASSRKHSQSKGSVYTRSARSPASSVLIGGLRCPAHVHFLFIFLSVCRRETSCPSADAQLGGAKQRNEDTTGTIHPIQYATNHQNKNMSKMLHRKRNIPQIPRRMYCLRGGIPFVLSTFFSR